MTFPSDCQPTVFVVDDDRQMRESLIALLEALGYTVAAFPSAAAFRRAYRRGMAGCLLLDVRIRTENGLQAYEQFVRDGYRLPVVFITAHADVSTAVAAMKTGAIEFLEKPFDRRTLVDRVQHALAVDATWRRREAEFDALQERMERLSTREFETLDLILGGASNKLMAQRLFISERAVEMRRAAIMRKLQVESLAELLDLAVRHRVLVELRGVGHDGEANGGV